MADIIAPRRGEELTPEGKPTVRFSEYLERVATASNESADVEVLTSLGVGPAQIAAIFKILKGNEALESLDVSVAQIAMVLKAIKSIELSNVDNLAAIIKSSLDKKINDLALTSEISLMATIASLSKRIKDLEEI